MTADRIVGDLNGILADRDLWTPSARVIAAQRYHATAVDCFYDDIQTKVADPWSKRDEVMPLPSAEDGFSTVLVAGPTGAGKTTLIRQLLGTDPERERFPSTSPSRTTIFDTEIICQAGDFAAVVSFLSRAKTRSHIEECVEAAVIKAAEGLGEEMVRRSFLIHSEERFRLSYILGSATSAESHASDEDDEDSEPEAESEEEHNAELSPAERAENAAKLAGWLRRCTGLAATIIQEVETDLGDSSSELSDRDRDAFLQFVEGEAHGNEAVQELVDEVLDEVEARFSFTAEGAFERDKSEWPIRWQFQSADRETFLKTVRRFSGNSAALFGRLLTPLVEGMRVRGPFAPANWSKTGEIPPLVLLDGEGIGHVRSTSAQVPTSVTRRYDLTHAILLVDTANQPMQAGAQALLRSVTASGHERKLAVVFTHFDQMKGDPFSSAEDKRNHVLASMEQGIQGVDEALDSQSGAARRLRRHLNEHVFFVGSIDRMLTERAKGTVKALNALLAFLQDASRPEIPIDATPRYDLAHLVLGLRSATDQFQKHWNARLGLAYLEGVRSEHWTRVQALSRRFAHQWDDKYDNMQPAAHLLALLQEKLTVFIATPRQWEPATTTPEAKDAAIEKVSRELFSRLGKFVTRRLCEDHLRDWAEAYSRRGVGSGRIRARDLRSINEDVAPIPGETPSPLASKLLDDIRELFREAAAAAGAKILAG